MNKLTAEEQWIADAALGALADNDANPDVGMGLFQSVAITDAIEFAKQTATLFAGGYDFMLLNVNRKNIEEYVREQRERRGR